VLYLAVAMMENASELSAFMSRIQSAELRAVLKLWDICRGRRRFPTWPQLDAQLHVLKTERIWAFSYNRITGDFTARFARNIPVIGFGKSFQGTRLQDLHYTDVFETVRANFLRVLTEPACCRWSGRLFKVGDQIVEGERILLPMGSAILRPDGIFGASDFDFAVTQTPERLETIHDIADWGSLKSST
jgi:hypothetical protein